MKLETPPTITERIGLLKNDGNELFMYERMSYALSNLFVSPTGEVYHKTAKDWKMPRGIWYELTTPDWTSHSSWVDVELPNPMVNFETYKLVRETFCREILVIMSNRKLWHDIKVTI